MVKIIGLLLLLSLSLFAKWTIVNFAKEIDIDKMHIQIMPDVIVKTGLSKKELQGKISRKITQLAFLQESNLFLVESNDSLEYAKELSKEDYIIYAQPNISQTKVKSIKESQDLAKKYDLEKLWQITKGEGVKIAIIDDGFNLEHEDLKDVDVLFSYDADNKNLDSSSKLKIDTHGTQVAGVIFAQHNNIGIDGIAPKASLIAIRQTTNITSDTILAFTVASKAGAHIINCSWNSPILLEPVYDVIKHLSRDTAVVFAAGNSAKEIKPYSTEASIPEILTIGATQKYSNYADILDFIIPSGVTTTKADGTYGKFGGTSATAPIISGLLALKLSQNKNKSIPEIIEILKKEINEN